MSHILSRKISGCGYLNVAVCNQRKKSVSLDLDSVTFIQLRNSQWIGLPLTKRDLPESQDLLKVSSETILSITDTISSPLAKASAAHSPKTKALSSWGKRQHIPWHKRQQYKNISIGTIHQYSIHLQQFIAVA